MPTDAEDRLYTLHAKEDDNDLSDKELKEMVSVRGLDGLKKLINAKNKI